jgi:hypothetical protein
MKSDFLDSQLIAASFYPEKYFNSQECPSYSPKLFDSHPPYSQEHYFTFQESQSYFLEHPS